jgi:hypothetical protein
LKSEDSPAHLLGNLQSGIEDLKSPGTLLGESSIQERTFNIESSVLDGRFSKKRPGEFSIFNLQSWLEDSPRRVLENLQFSIFNPGLKIPQEESWRIFNLQS